jgi:adenosylhomocysteine nucleosidase
LTFPFVLLLSANIEWKSWVALHPGCTISDTPYGGCFEYSVAGFQVLAMRGGWGKISAAASTQWAIDTFHPNLIINLGTCGGLGSRIQHHEIILVERTRVYDIQEQMSDPEEANRFYSSELDLGWLDNKQLPHGVIRETMFSADRDIRPEDVDHLIMHHNARVADWESGAIAWVARSNNTPILILRGVSDLVNATGGESYADESIYHTNTRKIMGALAGQLPWWLQVFDESHGVISPA